MCENNLFYTQVPFINILFLQKNFAGDTLLVGTRQGHLLVYSVRPNHGLPDRPFDTALERSNKSFAKKPIIQLEVVPEYHIVVSISGICFFGIVFYF